VRHAGRLKGCLHLDPCRRDRRITKRTAQHELRLSTRTDAQLLLRVPLHCLLRTSAHAPIPHKWGSCPEGTEGVVPSRPILVRFKDRATKVALVIAIACATFVARSIPPHQPRRHGHPIHTDAGRAAPLRSAMRVSMKWARAWAAGLWREGSRRHMSAASSGGQSPKTSMPSWISPRGITA
jgi:hypothetical protein